MFQQRLNQAADAVETYLSDCLDGGTNTPARLRDAMRHAVLGGGKRFRPFLVLESAALFGVPPANAVPVAAALECVHCYSLVHDDLPAMDNDALRRGQPTVWKAFDDWTAILAGDALLTLAFELIARPDGNNAAKTRAELCALLARAAGREGMVGGQCLDLQADKLGDPEACNHEHIRRLQSMKTGALIVFACEAGAVLADAGAEPTGALREYGRNLGYAFQIADDLLDAEGDATAIGKATGKDAKAGKATLVATKGVKAARAELQNIHAAACTALEPFGSKAALLRQAADFAIARTH